MLDASDGHHSALPGPASSAVVLGSVEFAGRGQATLAPHVWRRASPSKRAPLRPASARVREASYGSITGRFVPPMFVLRQALIRSAWWSFLEVRLDQAYDQSSYFSGWLDQNVRNRQSISDLT